MGHYEDMILSTPDLLSYWPMQETSGNIVDVVGGKTGTAGGSPVYAQSVSLPGLGSSDKSILIDGNPEGFDIQDNYDFLTLAQFSICGWFQITANPGWGMYLFQKGASQYGAVATYGSTMNFYRTSVGMTNHLTPAIGVPSHFAHTYNGRQIVSWLNGVPGTAVDTNNLADDSADLRLGCNRDGFAPIRGYIAHYYIVGRVLTAQEVWSHLMGGREMGARGFGGFS